MKKTLQIASWNVNGIRAIERKGFPDWLKKSSFDIVCLQETKTHAPEILSEELKNLDGYFSYWNSAQEKKGYSGVVIYTKKQPKNVKINFGKNILSKEGRLIELEFENFTLINGYFPNGGRDEERLNYKLEFYKNFLNYIKKLDKTGKKIIFCGDLNTAHHEIDLARPKANENNSGFMSIERVWLNKFEKASFIDTFRHFYPKKKDEYTWWDMKSRARGRNVGWRIDYFWINQKTKKHLKGAKIHQDIMGSDHCPVSIKLEM